jgi:regulatory protein YycI of two-component signal transduction system YycFG
MEWERAKTYILIAFLVLNLGLAVLIYRENRRFVLSPDRISNINEVLANNNISLYTHLMRRFAPMRHLDISGYYYDVEELLEIFFDGNFFEVETDEGYYIFEGAEGRLEISNGFVFFSMDLGEDENGEISRAEAIAVADEFIEKYFADFVRDIVFDEYGGEGVQIIYSQEYRGQLIFTNSIQFLVTARGIEWIEMQFGRVLGYSAEPRMIFAPDEILLTFMQRVRHEAAENPIFISHIDIVYYQEYASDQIGSVYPAVPVYRIFTNVDEFPFRINAFTNTFFE